MYVQLIELGVLLEEWDGDTCHVRFAFDRLFEFLLAEMHDPRVQDAAGAIALAVHAVTFKSLRGVLEVILGRACEQGRDHLLVEVMDQSSAHEDPRVRELLHGVAATLLERFARERDPAFERILAAMPSVPSVSDVEVLLRVADRLAPLGAAKSLDALLATLVAEATALEDPRGLGRALLRQARRLDVRGEWNQALDHCEAAARSAKEAQDPVTKGQAGLLAASLRGDLVEADRLCRASLAICEELGDRAGVAKCLNNLGMLAKFRGDLTEADRLYRASLAIREELGDKAAIQGRAYLLGIVVVLRGGFAVELFEQVRAIGASLHTPTAHTLAMQASLVLVFGSDAASPKAVTDALEVLREARRARSDRPDPEDGPATPLLLAARWFRDRRAAEQAIALAHEALAEVGDRLWPHRAEAEEMLR